MVRDALAVVRLLNHETRGDPDAPERRQRQRDHGNTMWDLHSDLVSEDLRGVLQPAKPSDALSDYDTPIPMVGREEDPEDEDTELSVRLIS